MLEIAWNAKKTWNTEKKIKLIYFFQYLKKFIKNSNNSINIKNYTATPPWHGARTCKVSRKYINAFLSCSAKTKRDGQTDGRTDRRGALQYLPSRAFGTAGDNKHTYIYTQCNTLLINLKQSLA